MTTSIHPLACVSDAAEISDGVEIGPFAVVEADVTIGPGCRVGSHAVIASGTRMGRDNRISPGAFVGADSQDTKFRGERSLLIMGDRNVVREAATLSRATGEGLATRVGNDNLIMAYAHVAHNCVLGDHTILANAATLAGWVTVGDYAIVGGLTAVHQFCRIGQHAIAGGKTKVTKDIPPFLLADGHPARPYGLNVVGLRRHGFAEQTIRDLRRAYKTLYHSQRILREALACLREEFPQHTEVTALISFIANSRRGIVRPRRQSLIV